MIFKVKVRCIGTAASNKLGGPRNLVSRYMTVIVEAEDAEIATINAVSHVDKNSPDLGVKWTEIEWLEVSKFPLPVVLDEGKNIVLGTTGPKP